MCTRPSTMRPSSVPSSFTSKYTWRALLLVGGLFLLSRRSQGGMTQMVPAAQIQSTKPLGRSLMLSAEQLGLGAQEIADVLAYLKSL